MAFRPGMIEDAIVRQDGSNELIGIGTVTLPDIENKTETIIGLGTDEYEHVLSTAFNALTLKIKFIGPIKTINFSNGKVVSLIIKAAIGGLDDESHEEAHQVITVSMKGRVKKRSGYDLGKATKAEPEIEFSATYYKLEIDGEVITEIDKLNRIVVIDGNDLRAPLDNLLA